MLNKITKFFEKDRFCAYNGIKIVEAKPGYAVTKLEVTENHLNGVGVIQGGAIFTLADFAFAVASNTQGQVTLSINANINFFKSTNSKTVIAEAKEVSSNNKIVNYNVDVFDENKELLARVNVSGYRKKDKIEF
jgi:acyl-CoA thioesterase